MSTRRLKWVVPIGLAVVVILGLIASGSRGLRVRAASADVPNQVPLPVLHPGGRACEGPLVGQLPTRTVGVWGVGSTSATTLNIDVQDAATHGLLARGRVRASAAQAEWIASLDRTVARGRPVRICVIDRAGAFSLFGSSAGAPNLTATGLPPGQKFSMVMLDGGSHSLLGSLSTAFSRASLWRPSWVGPWTFWLLLAAVAATFGLAVFAVGAAADDGADPRPPSVPEEPSPDAPPSGRPSETSEDRPQPVS